jgi:hypothetical protein
MKSMDPKRSDQGYIKEKMRVEETKAQLASAREGMERQAAQLKIDKEKKDEKKQANQASIPSKNPRFGAAAASMSAGGGGTGTKWLPPHLRAGGGGASMTRAPMPGSIGGFQKKVDVSDEQLFPDLATADAIIEKQELASRAPKKTPVGGGATWANKMKKPVVRAPKASEAASPIVGKESEEPAKTETAAPASAAPVAKAPKRVVKKKKDLSTFKPGSS